MSQMKALTSLQVAAVKDSNKLEFKAQLQLMQRRNEKERFSGLHINDLHNFSNIMQQFSTTMGTSFMGRQQSPWQQQSMMPMMQQGLPNYMMQQQQSMMPMMQQPNYMMQHGMMQQPNSYWCYPNGMMQQPNWNGSAFSMQQQGSAFPMEPQQSSTFPMQPQHASTFSMQSSQEGANAQPGTSTYCMQPSENDPPIQQGSDEVINQLRQFPSNAEDRDFGLEIPE
jgi:hypothetical protein